MNVTRKEQRIIQRALNAWQASGELTPSDSQRLAQTMRVSPFDWRRLSRYAFYLARRRCACTGLRGVSL